MIINLGRNIWGNLNSVSGFDQWLAVSLRGEQLSIVNFPKDSMLTHISENHLGVRLDDITFALFEVLSL